MKFQSAYNTLFLSKVILFSVIMSGLVIFSVLSLKPENSMPGIVMAKETIQNEQFLPEESIVNNQPEILANGISIRQVTPFNPFYGLYSTCLEPSFCVDQTFVPECYNEALVSFKTAMKVPADFEFFRNPPRNTLRDKKAGIMPKKNNADLKSVCIVKGDEAKILYYPIIERVAGQYELDPLLVQAIIEAESGFNPLAVSRVGARGLMQLMPRTAKAMGVKDSFNPEHNIAGGVKYFKKMLDKFDGDVKLALAAYNAGSRKVREYQGVPPYAATRYYIKKVCKLHQRYLEQKLLSEENV